MPLRSAAVLLLASAAMQACSSSPRDELPSPSASAGSGGASGGAAGSDSFGFAGSPGSGTCVPAAPQTFANAVCVCTDLVAAGGLDTMAPAGGAASIGVDGNVSVGAAARLEGSLSVGNALDVGGLLSVRDDVTAVGNALGAGIMQVNRDLSVGDDFTFLGALTVGGTLRLARPATVLLPLGPIQTGPYVAPAEQPCGCDPSSILPIAAEVTAAATNNDNAAFGLGTDAASFVGLGDVTLPTGKYYFKEVTDLGAGRITIQGAVALYIDGSLSTLGLAQLQIAAGGSLDVYVSGVVLSLGAVQLGDPAHPEAFRLFVGGQGSLIATAGVQSWNGLVYAPNSPLDLGGVTVVHGSIFAKSLAWGGILSVNYAGSSTGSSCMPNAPTSPPGAQ